MLLVVTYSKEARATLRNVVSTHDGVVVRTFGRAALLEATEFGAFLALRLREKHGQDVQVDQTEPFNEFETVPRRVRAAASAYESRETASTPYTKFAAGTEHPDPETMQDAEL